MTIGRGPWTNDNFVNVYNKQGAQVYSKDLPQTRSAVAALKRTLRGFTSSKD
jgi:hypothetical protein